MNTRRFEAFVVGSLPPMNSSNLRTFSSNLALSFFKPLISVFYFSIMLSFCFAFMREKPSSKPGDADGQSGKPGDAGELDLDLFGSLEAAGDSIKCFLCGGGDANRSFACTSHHEAESNAANGHQGAGAPGIAAPCLAFRCHRKYWEASQHSLRLAPPAPSSPVVIAVEVSPQPSPAVMLGGSVVAWLADGPATAQLEVRRSHVSSVICG